MVARLLSLTDLSEVSGMGFLVYQDKLPLAPGLVEMVGQENAIDMALSAGGDYELVFTLRSSGLEAARRACDLTVIGEVVEEGIWMERAGEEKTDRKIGL